jgi:elongation factor Ts
MTATIDKIKALRDRTGAPIMECKTALEENKGDVNKAEAVLKKKGLARVRKKKEEMAQEGLVHCYIHADSKVGAMVKLCCQTDFVARNKEFEKLAHEICMQIAAMNPKSVDKLVSQPYIRDEKKTVADLIDEAIAKFGENIKIEEFVRLAI